MSYWYCFHKDFSFRTHIFTRTHTPPQTAFIVDTPGAQYFFAVAQQPDIVNTAWLNGEEVTHPITVRAIFNTIAVEPLSLERDTSTPINPSDHGITCSTSDATALQLVGEHSLLPVD